MLWNLRTKCRYPRAHRRPSPNHKTKSEQIALQFAQETQAVDVPREQRDQDEDDAV